MGDGADPQRPDAARRLRARRPARRRGHHHPGHLPVAGAQVVLYTAQGCHLCERAREVLAGLRGEAEFELREVDITGDPALEAAYREWIPVVEIDGRRRFTYYVQPEAFLRAIAHPAASSGEPPGSPEPPPPVR